MRTRVAIIGAVATSTALLVLFVWALARPDFGNQPALSGPAPKWSDFFPAVAWTGTGAVLLWLRPRNAVGGLVLFMGVCQAEAVCAIAYGSYGATIASPHWPAARWVAFVGVPLWLPGVLPSISVLLAIYPDGRLPGPRWRLPVAAAAIGTALLTLAATSGYHDIVPGPPPVRLSLSAPLTAVLFAATGISLVGGTLAIWVMSVRRWRAAEPPLRQQLAWLLFAVVPFFLLGFATRWQGYAVALPIAIAVGVFRYRLLGIDVVLRRGLVYAVLTATVIGVYLLVTALAGTALNHGPLPGVVAAALVAMGFTPLRERVQYRVDRLVYGDRRDPMRAITRIGDSVAAAGQPDDLLPAVLLTVVTALRAPGAAVLSAEGRPVAMHGSDADGETLPLLVSGRSVGTLRLAARRAGEPYTAGDRRLLSALAPQVAVVVRALELAEALEAERDRVLAATRDERNRLRRDLHDGLGPSLSGVSLGLEALETALAVGNASTASALLGSVRAEAATAVVEVRRILDDLRPAALDDVGLAAAMRRHADSISAGVPIDLVVSEPLAPLPAGVETAAYRIAQEALTNVIRHAGASRAKVSLATEMQSLRIEIADDGHGFRVGRAEGVGLASMRHRAETLGGSLHLTTSGDGTSVVVTLPLPRDADQMR